MIDDDRSWRMFSQSAAEWNCKKCHDYHMISNIQQPTFECPNCGAMDSWYIEQNEIEPTHNED